MATEFDWLLTNWIVRREDNAGLVLVGAIALAFEICSEDLIEAVQRQTAPSNPSLQVYVLEEADSDGTVETTYWLSADALLTAWQLSMLSDRDAVLHEMARAFFEKAMSVLLVEKDQIRRGVTNMVGPMLGQVGPSQRELDALRIRYLATYGLAAPAGCSNEESFAA